jgi:hypothetical protein
VAAASITVGVVVGRLAAAAVDATLGPAHGWRRFPGLLCFSIARLRNLQSKAIVHVLMNRTLAAVVGVCVCVCVF